MYLFYWFAHCCFNHNSFHSRAITEAYTADLVLGTSILSTSIGTNAAAEITGIATGVNTFVYTNTVSTTATNLKIVGVRAQQTVINSTDVTVDDQSASDYIRIGGMLQQWGNSTSAGTTGDVVTFPTAFADTSYAVTCTCTSGGNGQTITVTSKSTTSFTVTTVDVNGTPQNNAFSWVAMGT